MVQSPDVILVPVDGSQLAETAIEWAAMLAQRCAARLVLFTAVSGDEREALAAFATGEGISLEEATQAYLSRVAASVPAEIEVEAEHRVADRPAAAIIDFADAVGASMIVMASHGRSGFTKWLLGSVADKVAQSAPIPVVIVPVR